MTDAELLRLARGTNDALTGSLTARATNESLILSALRAVRDASAPKPLPVKQSLKDAASHALGWLTQHGHHADSCRKITYCSCGLWEATNNLTNALNESEAKPLPVTCVDRLSAEMANDDGWDSTRYSRMRTLARQLVAELRDEQIRRGK